MDGIALDVGQDAVTLLTGWGPSLVLIFLLFVVMLYVLAYISRFFQYLKMQESRVLDAQTLDSVHRVLEIVWVGIVGLIALLVAQFQSPEARALLAAINSHFPAIFLVAMVLFVAFVLVRMLHRFAQYLRGELPAKPKRLAPPRLLNVSELFLKYTIYGVAVVVAFVGGIAALPEQDIGLKQWIQDNIVVAITQGFWNNLGTFGFAAVTLLAAHIAVRFSDSLFEDFKKRSSKFTPRILDVFKRWARWGIYFVAVLVAIFTVLSIFLAPTAVAAAAALIFLGIVVLIAVTFDTIRNGLSGVSLMTANPFEEGDRVKIGDDLVCDVLQIGLTMTQVRTLRGEVVNLPNRQILHSAIVNFTRSEVMPIVVEMRVPFGVPHARVEELFRAAAARTEGLVNEPVVEVYARDIDGGRIDYQLIVHTREPTTMKSVKSRLIYTVQELFQEAGIDLKPGT